MTKNFSLLLPTRERPRLVKRLLESIVQTTADKDCLEIVLCLDEDDSETEDICRPLMSVTTVRGNNDTMGRITRRCYEKSQGKYIMLLNDDMVFRTRHWDVKVLESFSSFPDEVAMVYGNDLYYGKKMCTFPILPRVTCELMDKICPGQYRRHCIDPHIFDIFHRLAGLGFERSVYLHGVIFEHMLYHLGALLGGSQDGGENDEDDQNTYFSLADHRRRIAERMVQHIESKRQSNSDSRQAH